MKSLKEIFVYGPGPSSSHTIGPYKASLEILKAINSNDIYKQNAKLISVTLYGSLALSGKGHRTDAIIKQALSNYETNIIFDISTRVTHPNTLKFDILDSNNKKLFTKTYLSIGGGAIVQKGHPYSPKEVYPFNTFNEMKQCLLDNKSTDLYYLIEKYEDPDIFNYGKDLLLKSFNTIEAGLNLKEDVLPGSLKLPVVANKMYLEAKNILDASEKRTMLISAYSYAAAECNALGQNIVTAPTCGSAGVLPSILYYEYNYNFKSLDEITKAFLVSGLIGNLIKQNASISGACHGCQAEIGAASSMASAALSYLYKLDLYKIEYASEVSMEHFLGLTCDPVDGYVQIPCIERNAIAAIHSYAAFVFAKDIAPLRQNKVSFDNVIKAMKKTGEAMKKDYKETSLGGLASIIN